jgi:hypothetical protein
MAALLQKLQTWPSRLLCVALTGAAVLAASCCCLFLLQALLLGSCNLGLLQI